MHQPHSARRGTRGPRHGLAAALLLGLTSALVPGDAAAQGVQSTSRSAILQYARANASRNGYEDAGLWFTYHFAPCVGSSIQVMAQLNLIHFQAQPEYWYQGRKYPVPNQFANSWRELTPGQVTFTATVSTPGGMQERQLTAFARGGRCDGWQHAGVQQADLWDAKATPQQKIDAMSVLSVGNGVTAEPLRNPKLEQHFAQEIAQARRDSVTKANARRDSVAKAQQVAAARRDSAQRATQQGSTRPQGSTAGAAGASGGAASGGGRAGSGGATTGTRAQTAQERQADSVAQAAAARQEAIDNVNRMLEQQRAANEARDAQIDQAAQELGDMVGAIMRDRAEQAERRRLSAVAAQERKDRAQLLARAAYLRAPEAPRCTSRDATASVAIGTPVHGALTLQNCRLADSASAVIHVLNVTRKEPIEIHLSAQFYGRVILQRDGSVVARTTADYEILDAQVTPGQYQVVVTSDALGETGAYTLSVKRGTQSHVHGLILGLVAGTGSSSSDFGPAGAAEGGLVVGFGMGDYFALLGQAGTGGAVDDGSEHVEGGARLYLLNRHSRWRPWGQYLHGKREYCIQYGTGFTDWGCFSGTGGNMGAGVSWFVAPKVESEIGFQRATTTFDHEGTTQTVAETRFLFGFSFHWYSGPRR